MIQQLPSDFDPEVYLALNPDLVEAGVDPVRHYLDHGASEGRPYRDGSRIPQEHAIAMPLDYKPEYRQRRVGVFCHIYYAEMADEILGYLHNVPGSATDIFLTTDTEEKKQALNGAFATWTRGDVTVKIVPNRGRDIAPKLLAFPDAYEHYDYVLHIHSKASPHHEELRHWRQFLYTNLMGSEAIVSGILECFEQVPTLGMVGPQHVDFLRAWIGWGRNRAASYELADRMGVNLNRVKEIDFISGSMFWARPAALAPLLRLSLSFDDFPEETRQEDATLAHAIERLFLVACETAGFDWIKVVHPTPQCERGEIHRIGSPAELRNTIAATSMRLLG